MSKAAQRKRAIGKIKQDRFEHGRRMAEVLKKDEHECISYYHRCMAWRAGFLSNGGKKFW